MDAKIQPPRPAAAVGVEEGTVVVAPAEPGQRAIVDGLQSDLDDQPGLRGKLAEGVQDVVAQAVRAGGDPQAHDLRMGHRLEVSPAKLFGRPVGVRAGLEIGQKTRVRRGAAAAGRCLRRVAG